MAVRSGFAPFIDAVAEINHEINPDCRIKSDAKLLVGLHMYGLIKDICTRVSEVTTEKSRVQYTDIVGVMSSFFTGDILALAHDEGSRRTFLYFAGMLSFNPKEPPKPGLKREDTELLRIMRVSVGNFIASKNKERVMRIESFDEGCIKVATIMFRIAKFLQSALSDISREENLLEIDDNHVQRALGDALPENLRQHAIHHSKTNVEKYFKGEYKYDVTETNSKLNSASRKKLEKDFTEGVLERQRIPANTPGIEEINGFIGDVCDTFIKEFSRQKPPLSIKNVTFAVERLFPRDMAHRALSNAAQALLVSSSLSSSA